VTDPWASNVVLASEYGTDLEKAKRLIRERGKTQ
jgi:hypothetical protein